MRTLSFPLKVSQSISERQPSLLVSATVQSMASVPPIAERPAVTVIPLVPETVPVATLANVFTPLKYGMLPITAAVEVERPPNVRVPEVVIVPPRMGNVLAILVTVPVFEER